MTDCRPISLFSIQTGGQLGNEVGTVLDKRRFRANIYMDLASAGGFAEDAYVGRTMRIGLLPGIQRPRGSYAERPLRQTAGVVRFHSSLEGLTD